MRRRRQNAEAGPDRLTFDLPEPPTINAMLRLYSRWQRRGDKRIPMYHIGRGKYELKCDYAAQDQGIRPPPDPWPEWRIETAIFRVWGPKDPVELLASLKWAVDWLVRSGYVKDDSPAELRHIPEYFGLIERDDPRLRSRLMRGICQTINRGNRGVELTIAR